MVESIIVARTSHYGTSYELCAYFMRFRSRLCSNGTVLTVLSNHDPCLKPIASSVCLHNPPDDKHEWFSLLFRHLVVEQQSAASFTEMPKKEAERYCKSTKICPAIESIASILVVLLCYHFIPSTIVDSFHVSTTHGCVEIA